MNEVKTGNAGGQLFWLLNRTIGEASADGLTNKECARHAEMIIDAACDKMRAEIRAAAERTFPLVTLADDPVVRKVEAAFAIPPSNGATATVTIDKGALRIDMEKTRDAYTSSPTVVFGEGRMPPRDGSEGVVDSDWVISELCRVENEALDGHSYLEDRIQGTRAAIRTLKLKVIKRARHPEPAPTLPPSNGKLTPAEEAEALENLRSLISSGTLVIETPPSNGKPPLDRTSCPAYSGECVAPISCGAAGRCVNATPSNGKPAAADDARRVIRMSDGRDIIEPYDAWCKRVGREPAGWDGAHDSPTARRRFEAAIEVTPDVVKAERLGEWADEAPTAIEPEDTWGGDVWAARLLNGAIDPRRSYVNGSGVTIVETQEEWRERVGHIAVTSSDYPDYTERDPAEVVFSDGRKATVEPPGKGGPVAIEPAPPKSTFETSADVRAIRDTWLGPEPPSKGDVWCGFDVSDPC